MRSYLHIIPITILFICISCRDNLDYALELAGDNKEELVKVLEHYKNDPDTLKYGAARFLIENMAYHHTYYGDGIDAYDSVYMAISAEPIQYRDSVFKKLSSKIDLSAQKVALDITQVKADYLIKAIDDACDVWRGSSWSKEFDASLFYDYVLPYRLLNEPLSDWRSYLDGEYKYLSDESVMSKRGEQIEAELAKFHFASVVSRESASNGKMVFLEKVSSRVDFLIDNPCASRKCVFLRYTCPSKDAEVTLELNGHTLKSVVLDPTNTLNTFRNSRVGIEITLPAGENILSVKYANNPIGLDYIQLATVEQYHEASAPDLSDTYCTIQNKQTCNYICFDTLKTSLLNMMELTPFVKNDSTQMLRLKYLGYGSWSVSSFNQDSVDLCMEVKYCRTNRYAPVSQYHFLNGNQQKWVFLPVENGYYKIMSKDTGLFLEARSVQATGRDTIVQNAYSGADTQKWKVDVVGKYDSKEDNLFRPGNSISVALKVFDVTNQFEWYAFNGAIPPKASSLCQGRTGNCRDEASYVVYLCRYMGIPSAIDFTPHWGNRSQAHSWSVLIMPDGTSTPFYMGCAPGDTAHYYHSYKKPKVLRHRFRLNRVIANDLAKETSFPSLFKAADFIDVTDEYYTTTNVERTVPKEYGDKHVAYICVFDNRNWVPVYYGNVKDGKVMFPSMGRGIVYMSAFYENGQIKPFGEPFLVDYDGTVKDIKADNTRKQDMKLLRKYPFMGKEDHFNARMSGGRFQGSNTSDFFKVTDLYMHEGLTNGNWYDIPIDCREHFRYLRYMGPNGSYCNINELEFYDEANKLIEGVIIGTEGNPGSTKDKVFDGNILTGFCGVSPDGHWVGIRTKTPKSISRIRYIPRNDGNGIEIGDKYELVCWNDGDWKILTTVIAKENMLKLKNMPSGGLYVLKNLTKGHEERIFTYEGGKQVWW